MSRFEPNLMALGEAKWNQIYGMVKEILPDSMPNDDKFKAELGRLARATEFISSTVVSAHPFAEFINQDIQNHVTNFESRLNQLKSMQPSELPNQVNELNSEITTILDRLSPYLSKGSAAKAAGKASGQYKKTVEEQENEIKGIRAMIDDYSTAIEKAKFEVANYRLELLVGTEEKPSIDADISEKASQIDKMLSTTKNFYQMLTEGDSESVSIQHQIVEAHTRAVENSEEISEKLRDAERKLKELDRVHSEVMGSDEKDGTQTMGLKAQLEERQAELNKMLNTYHQNYVRLSEKIEGLLPGATSAGLAAAYKSRRRKAEKSALLYSRAFFSGVFVLAVLAAAISTETFSLWPYDWDHIRIENPKEYIDKILFRLPIVIPVLWATLTVSKRRSEMQRLAEEYRHKETLAQSYEGFKKQIDELDKKDESLVQNLLEVILKAMSINAAKTLEGKHGEKMPMQGVLEGALRKPHGN